MRAAVVNQLWRGVSRGAFHRFQIAAEAPDEAQEEVLLRLVRRNARTWFGRRHGFSRIRGLAAFQNRVPISSYRDYEAAIARIRAGEKNVLTSEPVLRLVPTSGTACARKRIPYTRSLLLEYERAVSVWISDLFEEFPEAFHGRAYWALSPPLETQAPSGSVIPEGFEADHTYLGRIGMLLKSAVLAVGPGARFRPEIGAFRRETLSALIACEDLALVSVWHPSFMLLLLEALPELLPELAQGIPASRERLLRARTAPPGERARVIWPRLALVSAWLDGPAAAGGRRLEKLLPGVPFQAKGLMATEGVVSIPSGRSGCSVPALTSHFLEFLDPNGKVRTAGQLETGQTYEVLLTTGGGFTRYGLGDRVTVAGHSGKLPRLAFAGRSGGVSDRFGEKLDDELVARAIGTLLEELALDPELWFLSFEEAAGGYVLFLEAAPNGAAPRLDLEVDSALRRIYHYDVARRLGQLGPARVFWLARGSRARVFEVLGRGGKRASEVKPGHLSLTEGWLAVLDGRLTACRDEEKP